MQVKDSTASTDTEPYTYNPLCCNRELHGNFLANPIESNSKPVECQIENGQSTGLSTTSTANTVTPVPTIHNNNGQQVHEHF